jgi:hypothetical protein
MLLAHLGEETTQTSTEQPVASEGKINKPLGLAILVGLVVVVVVIYLVIVKIKPPKNPNQD